MSEDTKLNANSVRQLEVEAYSALVSTFFAQGELTWRKEQLLQEARWALKIPDDIHRRELQRVHADTNLAKIRNNTVKDQFFPGVTSSNSTASETTEDATSQTKRLYVYPAARTLKGEPLSVPGNIIVAKTKPTTASPKLANVSTVKQTPRTTRRPSKSSTPKRRASVPSPRVTKPSRKISRSPAKAEASVTVGDPDELEKLKAAKEQLITARELITKELAEIKTLEEQELQKAQQDSEDEESEDSEESGESVSSDDDDEEEGELLIAD